MTQRPLPQSSLPNDPKQAMELLLAHIEQLQDTITEMETRQRKMEAQHRKILNMKGKKHNVEDKALQLEQVFSEARNGGCTSSRIEEIYNIDSRSGRVKKMRRLAEQYEKLVYRRGKGREPSKLFHKDNQIGADPE